MKNYHIILKEDGLYLADLPEKPSEANDGAVIGYDIAVKKAINDAVKLKDKVLGLKLFYVSVPKGQEQHDHPYKVDLSEYDVTRGYNHSEECRLECTCKVTDEVAILTPKKKEECQHMYSRSISEPRLT